MVKYTGIGSRTTPPPVLLTMRALAKHLARGGAVLRSGGAPGADQAFAAGAALALPPGARHLTPEIYLPWANFSGQKGIVADDRQFAAAMAVMANHHPAWPRLPYSMRRLHARNAFQVLGAGLDARSEFVACWTPDGAERAEETSITTGGTGSAIRLASAHGVPIYNLSRPNALLRLNQQLTALGMQSFDAQDPSTEEGHDDERSRRWRER